MTPKQVISTNHFNYFLLLDGAVESDSDSGGDWNDGDDGNDSDFDAGLSKKKTTKKTPKTKPVPKKEKPAPGKPLLIVCFMASLVIFVYK